MAPAIRRYEPDDRSGVLELCAATGLLGDDIGSMIPDRISFARIIALPYLRFEPELATVLDDDGVAGYSIGATAPWFDAVRNLTMLKELARIGTRLALDRSYRVANGPGFMSLASSALEGTPKHPKGVHAHVHLNLREDVRGQDYAEVLLERFEEHMDARGIDTYYGEVFTSQTHTKRAFERLGFEIYDSKPNASFGTDIELTTIVKRL